MKTIHFNLNWNGKLYCNCFSTIRPANPDKYQLNEVYEIALNGVNQGLATLVYLKDFKLSNITEAMSLTDTGYPAKYAIEVFTDLYPNITDIANQMFTYIILERTEKDYRQSNQLNENKNQKL